jgi:multidrug efflux pump subunit AcrA (membrane-fusion protein)
MLLFGKFNLNNSQKNTSLNYRDRRVVNWFRDIGCRELLLLLIYAVGLTTVIYLIQHQTQQPSSSLSESEQAIHLANLEFSGIVNPSKEFKIAATAPAVVKEVYVDIGDRLQPNQPILRLENLAAQQKLTQLQRQRLETNKEIDTVKQQQETAAQKTTQFQQQLAIIHRKVSAIEQLFNLELRLTMAELSLQLLRQQQDVIQNAKGIYLRAVMQRDRLAKLSSQGAAFPEEIERSQAQVKAAKTNLASTETTAKLKELERQQRQQLQLSKQLTLLEQQQQLAATQGQLELARLQSRQATRRLDLLYQQRSLLPKESDIAISYPVTAKEAGVVVNLPVVVGDQIYAGRSLVELAQLKSLKVQVSVGTRFVGALRLGQRAFVQVGKAASTRQFEATVVTINPIPEQNKTHTVEVQFQNPQGVLLVGQAAKVRFIPEK